MYGYIYKTTNLINNKIYIGQHKSSYFNVNYKGSGLLLQDAFKKYGKENFKVELLEWCESRDHCNIRECYYIKLYNSRDLNVGYNISQGGHERFFTGMHHNEESRKKMSERAKNRPHPGTTNGRVTYTNGIINKIIKLEDIPYWESQGFYKGKVYKNKDYHSWNKGLTKELDSRVQKNTDNRNKTIKEKLESGVHYKWFDKRKGHTAWNKGLRGVYKTPDEVKEKIRQSNIGKHNKKI